MATDSASTDLTTGMVIANRFRLERLLGQGGMGSVWVAHHLTLHFDVAVKFIDATGAMRDELQSRFAQEAQAAAKINSPHVVRMVDYGTDETGRPYIAMELLQGEELAKRLEREPQMSLADAGRVLSQACKGLTKAHQAGIVHRDLKPENIFLTEDEDGFSVKLLDFGIAKADSPIGPRSHKTGTGQLLGTPTYMSPEQALGAGAVDARSDLYSMATVLYRCLSGSVPFDCEGLGQLIVAISTQKPRPLSETRPDVGTSLDAWFERAMAKEPGARFPTAKDLSDSFFEAAQLKPLAGGNPTLSSEVPQGGVAGRVASAATVKTGTLIGASADGEIPGVPSKKPVGLIVGGLVGVIALAAVAAFALRAPPPPVVTATSPASSSRDAAPAKSSATPPPIDSGVAVTPADSATPAASASADTTKKTIAPGPLPTGRGRGKTPDTKTPEGKSPPPASTQKDYGI